MSNRKKGVFGIVLMLSLAGAASAWACSPQRAEITLIPKAVAAGDSLRVLSPDFVPGSTVEIRWASRQGPAIGGTVGPDRSVLVNTPGSAGPGVYYVVAPGAVEAVEILEGGQGGHSQARFAGGDTWSGFKADNLTSQPALSKDSRSATRPLEMAGFTLLAFSIVAFGAASALAVTRRRGRLSRVKSRS